MWESGGRELEGMGKVDGGWEGDVWVMREPGCGWVSRGERENGGEHHSRDV